MSYKRGYMQTLRSQGMKSLVEEVASQTGKAHMPNIPGIMIEGTFTKKKLETTQGPYALLETQRSFYLVPWRSVMEQTLGRRIHGRVQSGGGIDWEMGRSRGIGR